MNDFKMFLKNEATKEYYQSLSKFIDLEYQTKIIYPRKDDIFKALELTSYKDTKVVILGQDPYHNENEAMGLAFSVPKNQKIPPSLKNIYKELNNDLNILNTSGDLTNIALQGVLLLNTCLSVEKNKPNSHRFKGYEILTDEIIKFINKKDEPVCFVLWGNNAINKLKFINQNKHYVITSVHPSPLSAYRGFFGSKPFSKINKFLLDNYQQEINWKIED